MQTYLFYDIETTGLSKSFDQVLQFAAIRTDLNLQELERYELRIKLNPDVVPAPRALLTHRIGVDTAASGMLEIDAIRQIHDWLNTPGTISLGYNTLGFDDEFLRFSFYRNLLPPYSHQFANLCKRMDLYPVTVMYHLYKNAIIQWPIVDDRLSLKLENLNRINNFVQGRAHDAMVDVEITLALARRFFQEKDTWDYISHYFAKATDTERFHKLPIAFAYPEQNHYHGLMILGKFGAKENYQAPVLYLGESSTYKNQHLWLRLDTDNLPLLTEDSIYDNTWVVRKKLGEPPFILPPAERFLKHLSPKRLALAAANRQWLQDNPVLFQKIIDYHRAFVYPVFPHTDIDASLYLNGFWNDTEVDFCRRFHRAEPTEKAAMTEKLPPSPLKSLALRLLGRNYPAALTPALKPEFEQYLLLANSDDGNSPVDFKGNKRLTVKLAKLEIAAIRSAEGLDFEQQELLTNLEKYLNNK